MAGPIIRISVANKADSSKRFDLITLWTESDSRFQSQLRASVADATSDGSEQYPEMMITDWLRALAGGDRFHINRGFWLGFRVRRSTRLTTTLQARRMTRHSDPTPPTYTGYRIRVGRDGVLWTAILYDRYGRAHRVTDEPATLGTIWSLVTPMIQGMEQ